MKIAKFIFDIMSSEYGSVDELVKTQIRLLVFHILLVVRR